MLMMLVLRLGEEVGVKLEYVRLELVLVGKGRMSGRAGRGRAEAARELILLLVAHRRGHHCLEVAERGRQLACHTYSDSSSSSCGRRAHVGID